MGLSAPSAGARVPVRLNQMFGKARNRCHATPIVTFNAITIAQLIEITILMSATTDTAAVDAGRIAPSACETGATQVGYGRIPLADFSPRITRPQTRTRRTTHST